MKKGISETFDEHEQKTAPRGYEDVPEAAIPDAAQATSKMSKFALERVLRTASGTRPAANRDLLIAEAVKAEMAAEHELDEFARPTMEMLDSPSVLSPPTPLAFVPIPLEATLLATDEISGTVEKTPELEKALWEAPAALPLTPPASRVPSWALVVVAACLLFLVSLAAFVGFVLGHHRH